MLFSVCRYKYQFYIWYVLQTATKAKEVAYAEISATLLQDILGSPEKQPPTTDALPQAVANPLPQAVTSPLPPPPPVGSPLPPVTDPNPSGVSSPLPSTLSAFSPYDRATGYGRAPSPEGFDDYSDVGSSYSRHYSGPGSPAYSDSSTLVRTCKHSLFHFYLITLILSLYLGTEGLSP